MIAFPMKAAPIIFILWSINYKQNMIMFEALFCPLLNKLI